jgi:hypothetical protein
MHVFLVTFLLLKFFHGGMNITGFQLGPYNETPAISLDCAFRLHGNELVFVLLIYTQCQCVEKLLQISLSWMRKYWGWESMTTSNLHTLEKCLGNRLGSSSGERSLTLSGKGIHRRNTAARIVFYLLRELSRGGKNRQARKHCAQEMLNSCRKFV